MVNYYTISKKRHSFLGYLSVTSILILVNIFTYILFSLLIGLKIIPLDFIAIKPSNILAGKDLWTLITSMFMHANFFHIFANMLSLFFLGSFIEKILGRKRYFYFYIIAGLVSGLFFVLLSLIFTSDLGIFAVGASGAIFGIAGLMIVLTPNLPLYVMFIPIPVKAKYAVPGLLVLLWLISLAGNVPIGNTAHLGGLLIGLIYGYYLRRKYKRKTQYLKRVFS